MITKLEVYDLECLSNLFTYTGYSIKEKKYYQYTICKWRNESLDLINHLCVDTREPEKIRLSYNVLL